MRTPNGALLVLNVLTLTLAGGLLTGCGSDNATVAPAATDASAGDATRGAPDGTGGGEADATVDDATPVPDGSATEASSPRDASGAESSTMDADLVDAGFPDAPAMCATFTVAAAPSPAAALLVLDRSASMAMSNKWVTAQIGMVQGLAPSVFDAMSIGLSTFPTGSVTAPACLDGIATTVACGVSAAPQVAIEAVGANAASASPGARHDIAQLLNVTEANSADELNSAPVYDTLASAYTSLKASAIDRRAAFLVIGTGPDCTSVATPARSGYSDGLCSDWENPIILNALITSARTDPAAPVETFVIGLPGTNSHANDMQGQFVAAPYNMLLALSTYAVSGAPDAVDPACDANAVFSQTGADPSHPCHLDLSNGATFNAASLAAGVQTLRQLAFGCVYDVPAAPPGQTIDPSLVNVALTVDGATSSVARRQAPTETCTATPCWDYDASGRISLLGAACDSISAAGTAAVALEVGCPTITN